MTTITVEGKAIPFDVALQRARIRCMTSSPVDVRSATQDQLKRRQKEIRHYLFLRKIDALTSAGIERRDTGEWKLNN